MPYPEVNMSMATLLPKSHELFEIFSALSDASSEIYSALKNEYGLKALGAENLSGDDQLELDVFADQAFLRNLRKCTDVRYVVSEERPDLVKVNNGSLSIALDPLDGSKSALVGIPSGAIFCIFSDVNDVRDFKGSSIVSSGFFVFGINLGVFFATQDGAFRGTYVDEKQGWRVSKLDSAFPSSNFFAINASNKNLWGNWLSEYYDKLIDVTDGKKPHNLRWYASMVSEVKRLLLQGGVFAYPGDRRDGYREGHLRLVYEAMPMAFLVEACGGASFDGSGSILDRTPDHLHQKTEVFLGETSKIDDLKSAKR
jgi:fructose-1,6-bisphosphatase I